MAISVMMDGGVRRGTDVLKALALGAVFVFVGRPFVYAAAIAGEAGVRHAINILLTEIDRNMGLLGISSLVGTASGSAGQAWRTDCPRRRRSAGDAPIEPAMSAKE